MKTDEPFSDQLESWLRSDGPKSLGALGEVFAEKSFAVTILLLMCVPALPLPTGGVTHVFEAITVVLAAEMVLGRRRIWLPERWQGRELGAASTGKAIPFIVRRVRWVERFSRPRGARLFDQPWLRLLGLVLVGFAVAAALAPPFSGLDTLPALGAVAVALAIIWKTLSSSRSAPCSEPAASSSSSRSALRFSASSETSSEPRSALRAEQKLAQDRLELPAPACHAVLDGRGSGVEDASFEQSCFDELGEPLGQRRRGDPFE